MNNVDEKRPPAERQVTPDEQVAPVTRVYGPEARVPKGVSFEEFAYWAKLDREEENMENIAFKEAQGPMSMKRLVTDRFSSGRISEHTEEKPGFFQSLKGKLLGNSGSNASVSGSTGNGTEVPAEASKGDVETTAQMRGEVEAEWKTASRALRTASWGSVFYLITTDILGSSSPPSASVPA
ncbi:hypothetical protein KEM55_008332 [Ascosphaera atra]|nr:hypothetical protein KEM55_008332 [Ascosphaera atra]